MLAYKSVNYSRASVFLVFSLCILYFAFSHVSVLLINIFHTNYQRKQDIESKSCCCIFKDKFAQNIRIKYAKWVSPSVILVYLSQK